MMTAETTAAAEVDTVLEGTLTFLLKKPDATVAQLADKLVPVPEREPVTEAAKFPNLPEQPDLTDAQRAALDAVPMIFGRVRIKNRRPLTEANRKLLMDEVQILGEVASAMSARLEVIKGIVRMGIDAQAEKEGRAFPKDVLGPDGEVLHEATPRDQYGHYLLAVPKKAERLPAGALSWSQEYAKGEALPADAVLQQLYKDGVIPHKVYLACTEEKRVLSTPKLLQYVTRNPREGLKVLRLITRRSAPSSRLNIRKTQ